MTASARRTLLVTMAALAVIALLVWSASTGPTGLAEGLPTRPVVTDTDGPDPAQDTGEKQRDQTPREQRNVRELGSRVQWLQDFVAIAAFLAGLWALSGVFKLLLRAVVRRLPEEQLVVDLEPIPDVGAARAAVGRDRSRHLEALDTGTVRDAIVACWILLEKSAATAGVQRRGAETPTEFVVRFLHRLDVDPRPVARLAALYREARFSSHPMGEATRTEARQALSAVHDDLSVVAAAPGVEQ